VGTTASVYVTNSGSNDVSAFSINPSTGGLAAIAGSPFKDIPSPSAIAVSPNGLFAYVANSRTNKVTAFRVGTNGGLLLGPSTQDTPNPASVGATPRALAISKNSQFLYVANSGSGDITVFQIGTAGVLTHVPQTEGRSKPVAAGVSSPIALTISPTGRFLYVANSTDHTITAFQVDAAGVLTLVTATAPASNPVSSGGTGVTALAMSLNGQFLYVTNGTSNTVTTFQVEASGLLTRVPPAGSRLNPLATAGTTPNGITLAPDGAHLYIANGGGNVSVFAIGSDGLLTLVPASGASQNPTAAGTNPVAVALSQDGQFLYVANGGGNVSIYTVVSGAGTLIPLTPLLGSPFPTGTNPSAIAALSPTS
jgi:6-phosphogluconolactonase (cycloisomerase 2 family)